MRRYWLMKAGAACATVGLLIFLAGCGAGEAQPSEITRLPPTTKLKVLGHATWFKSGWNALVKDAALHGFELEVETVPDTPSGNDLIQTRFATRDTPDILLYFPGILLRDFGPPSELFVKQEDQPWMANLDKDAWAGALDDAETPDGLVRGYYAVPYWGSNGSVILYNKKVFKAYSLNIPKTYAEFLHICETLKQMNVTPVYYSGKDAWTLQLLVFNAASKRGYHVLVDKINANQAKFTEYVNFKRGLEVMLELKNKSYINADYLSGTYDSAQKALATGKAGMYPMATWVMNDISEKYPDQVNDIGAFILPFDGDETDVVPVFAPYGMFVPKGKNQEAAQKFVNYFASIDTQNLYFAHEGGIPALKGVVQKKLTPAEADVKRDMDAGRSLANWQYAMKYNSGDLPAYIMDVLVGGKTTEQVLSAMDKEFAKDAKANGDPIFLGSR
ncbi:ABC transporter substrate-binding protein [Cohnella silvisoli]|uniref:Extracellular solute-binding protein n=1 Tax=Cohnella silvisoli TaxID=2873699 RepID=A0ABV1KU76_9BACL|nr:extracellular solute-binding protein [Cohnella silvisoli]MCD9023150.1 extracellular solute-binding protein [Cohnella silvisoli]